ncbi:MAG: S-methyl-5'-thioadenosine phosphorylase [Candidatus Dadabacteria bacterium]|nr:MAG: S-methyl-5'-thioadenosine phosphorylase [Candidatus Dadabacteria bacterium]
MTSLAVIGGTGFYNIEGLSGLKEERVSTPFGEPSDSIYRAELNGQKMLFLARHGRAHTINPTAINYRANIYALKALGARWCLGISAVGSLKEELHPGDFVVPDQFIDRTRQRPATFFDKEIVVHVGFADPFCPALSEMLYSVASVCAEEKGFNVHRGGTYLCMEGPQFSTRAESNMYRQWGASIIGMTCLTEARLAREAELPYATLAMVSDYDCWKEDAEDVDAGSVIELLKGMNGQAKEIVKALAAKVSECSSPDFVLKALDSAVVSDPREARPEVFAGVKLLLERYMSETAGS